MSTHAVFSFHFFFTRWMRYISHTRRHRRGAKKRRKHRHLPLHSIKDSPLCCWTQGGIDNAWIPFTKIVAETFHKFLFMFTFHELSIIFSKNLWVLWLLRLMTFGSYFFTFSSICWSDVSICHPQNQAKKTNNKKRNNIKTKLAEPPKG